MLGPSGFSTLYLFLQLSALFLGSAHALPSVARRSTTLTVRQNDGGLTQPVTVQTQDTLQTCVIVSSQMSTH